MKLTKYRSYPYPLQSDPGGAGLHLQKLAVAVDADAKTVENAWVSDLQRPSATFTGTDTGITNGIDFALAWATNEYTIGAPALQGDPAYWLITVNVALTASGTLNANTVRSLKAIINEQRTGGLTIAEVYSCSDFQADGTVYLDVEFVTNMGPGRFLEIDVNHGNSSSTLNAATRVSYTWLAPA